MCIDCLAVDPDPLGEWRVVTAEIRFIADTGREIADTGREIVARFSWDESDPWAITIDFGDPGEPWCIDRELLKEGLQVDAGLGDVRFRAVIPNPRQRAMILHSPDGLVVLRFDVIEMSMFMMAVEREVQLAAKRSTGATS